ncbi:uncharacterized protein LOC125955961 [Anopheles darlingi]|uniref:uncharacterized protein LOC125955961 n=1 Tax=Anopheles darlingi TaxID=43151 RepID=UPI0021003B4A|nr:uncharacterized protein LOC125955961 [Anopheles darlingi]
MKTFVLVSCCLVLASARPEAGYSYNRPSTGGGGGSHSGGGGGYSNGGSFTSGGVGGYSGGGGGGYSSGGYSSGAGASFGGSAGGFGGSSFSSSGGSSFGGGVSSFGGGGFGGGGSQQAIIQKHIYVHVPPPEPEEVRIQRPIQLAAPQKHYKIIFIKAPSAPAYQAPQIPLQPQNEEKTLVYVLVKKPDEQQDIVIPTPAPTQPSKPEVYFIKYKTQKESIGGGGAIGGGASFASGGGASFGDLGALGGLGGDLGGGHGGSIGGAGGHGGGDLGGHGGAGGGSGIGVSAPAAQYGPPGKSGPY